MEKYKSGEYTKPINIHALITVEGNKTTINYYGTATTSDGTVKYDKSFTVDCVFTKNIPEVFAATK